MENASQQLVYIYKAGKKTCWILSFFKRIPHTKIKIVSASNLKDDIICAVAHFSFLCIFSIMMLNVFLTHRFALILSEFLTFHSVSFKFCTFNYASDFLYVLKEKLEKEKQKKI